MLAKLDFKTMEFVKMKPAVKKHDGLSRHAFHRGTLVLLRVICGLFIVDVTIISLRVTFFDVRFLEQSGKLSGPNLFIEIGPKTVLLAIFEPCV